MQYREHRTFTPVWLSYSWQTCITIQRELCNYASLVISKYADMPYKDHCIIISISTIDYLNY